LEARLRQAEAEVFSPGEPGWAEFVLARAARDSAQVLLELPQREGGALLLLRDATDLAIRARLARSGAVTDFSTASRAELWNAFEALPAAKLALDGLAAAERDLARKAATEGANEKLCALQPEEHRAWTQALARFVPMLVQGLEKEANRVAHVRTLRTARIVGTLALLVAIVAVVVVVIRDVRRGENLALNRPVTLSSKYDESRFPAATVVDGDTSSLGCHTKVEQRPWMVIDLAGPIEIHEVVVFNRTDAAQERAAPLLIEVSTDGKAYRRFAQRGETFSVWHADQAPVQARYVRLTVLKHSALHFNEVEVY
jgi:hypothetical protein